MEDRNVKPKSTLPLMAPNMMSQVQQTIDEHPEIDTMNEEARGEIIDITDWRVNGGADRPWGRKARNNDPNNPNLNTDGMTYLRPDGLFEIYDCISGIDGSATWEGYGPFAQGENGYWWPPQPVENQPTPPVDVNKDQEQDNRIQTLEFDVNYLRGEVNSIKAALDAVINTMEDGLYTHGPVDLPIVLESLTRMRAKGDINVAVKVGKATPPVSYETQPPTLVDVAVLKRITKRD